MAHTLHEILHIVTQSPWTSSAFKDCMEIAAAGDAVLLLADGVYACAEESEWALLLNNGGTDGIRIFALSEDCVARGLNGRNTGAVALIGYDEFVTLAVDYPRAHTWY